MTTQTTLLQGLTIRESIRRAGTINPLTTATTGHPVYFVHSITGRSTDFNKLAVALGDDLRLYALATPSRLRNGGFVPSITAAARFYVEAITAHQPAGPLSVAGWSAGAAIALEIAQQLRALGREVPMLFVLDGLPGNIGTVPGRRDPRFYLKILRRLPRWYAGVRGGRPGVGPVRLTWEKLLKFSCLLGRKASVAASSRDPIKECGVLQNYLPAHQDYIRCFHAAAESHVPQTYAGQVTVYEATEAKLLPPYVDESWRHVAPHAAILPIQSDHVSLVLGDDARKLASLLGPAIRRLEPLQPPTALPEKLRYVDRPVAPLRTAA